MSVRLSKYLFAVLALAALSGSVSAQSFSDTGKKKLLKLFDGAVSPVSESTVRVLCDSNDAALGTIVSTDGLVLTKGSELRGSLSCVLNDGTSYDATYVGYHKPTDLALLKLDVKGLKAVVFADPTKAVVGNWVAIPNHKGIAVSVGVLSAAARKLYGEEGNKIENSNKGFLGIALADSKEGEGVVVNEVMPKGAAAAAGMKRNDLICEIAGMTIKNRAKMFDLLEGYRPGDKIDVRVKRGDEEVKLRVQLIPKADISREDYQNTMGGSLSGRRTGFPSVIQHDTVVTPKDCGGPLVDLDGKVLGINIARAGRVETWTLPANIITSALKDLKDGKFPPPGK